MRYQLIILPSKIAFTANNDETILSAALNAKVNLPHGCKNGSCGLCKCQIINGDFKLDDDYDKNLLSVAELADKTILACKTHAHSDLIINLSGFTNTAPIKTIPAKISYLDKIASITLLKLKLPTNLTFNFRAGQYIDILYQGQTRSYSIANAPTADDLIELHVRYRNGGLFSGALGNELTLGSVLRFTGPFGQFTLQDGDAPILMICTGTGFAPIKAILEEMLHNQDQRKIHLIWGNPHLAEFYLLDYVASLQKQLQLNINLCVDNNAPDDFFNGLVTDFLEQHYSTLANHHLYACGNQAMVANIHQLTTTKLQLNPKHFFADMFVASK